MTEAPNIQFEMPKAYEPGEVEREWYRQHPTIKMGDKVTFKVIEPLKKYRLEIVK